MAMNDSTAGRLDAYLGRIGLAAAPDRTTEGLAILLAAHRRAIAFENLDIRLGRPIAIDSDSVFDKLVRRGRGGYCFEQNRLLADMLLTLGYDLRPLLARVRLGGVTDRVPVRSHVALLVSAAGQDWLVDGGFGGSDLPVLALADGAGGTSPDGAGHRLRKIGHAGDLDGAWLLERAGPRAATDGRALAIDGWQPQYSFDLAQVAPADLEQCNHWTSTRAGERFTTLHIATMALPVGFASLIERTLSVHDGGETQQRRINDPADYAVALRDLFGLTFSEDEAAALPLFAGKG